MTEHLRASGLYDKYGPAWVEWATAEKWLVSASEVARTLNGLHVAMQRLHPDGKVSQTAPWHLIATGLLPSATQPGATASVNVGHVH